MNEQELLAQIRYLRDVEHLSFRVIGKRLGLWRERCSRIYSGKAEAPRAARPRLTELQPYRQLVAEWYEQHPGMKATQVFARLKARGVKLSYPSIMRFTREFRVKRTHCYHELNFGPGEEAQVDWFLVTHPVLGKLAGFAMILSFSRQLFAHIFPRLSFEFFIDGHLRAFEAFNGLPFALRYDNLRSVVIRRQPLTYNAAFLEFAHHYGFEIRLCNVRAGNEKGRVERAIRTIRESFLNTANQHASLAALNGALHDWLTNKNSSVHRTTNETPEFLFQQERLKPLPVSKWLNRTVHIDKRPSKTGLLAFDSNFYSVPEYLVSERLSLHVFCNSIEVYDPKGNKAASHPRSFERNKTFTNPLHRSFGRLSPKSKADRVFDAINRLAPLLARFLSLNQARGEDAHQAAYLIFRLLRAHPRAVILSAVREALDANNPYPSFIISRLEPATDAVREAVSPQDKRILSITFKPRLLKDYEL